MIDHKIPKTDSISELAVFWDQHDITDYEDSLEEVEEPLFKRGKQIQIQLQQDEFDSIERLALKRGLEKDDLIRKWIVEKLNAA